MRQTGVIRVDTLGELLDVASLLAHQPVPRGRRVAVMSNGGGPAIVAADACAAAGLDVPELSESASSGVCASSRPPAACATPSTSSPAPVPTSSSRPSARSLESGEVDALLVIYVAPYVTHAEEIEAAITRAAARAPRDTTIACCLLGIDRAPETLTDTTGEHTIPTFVYPEYAARALADAARLGVWRRRPPGTVLQYPVDFASRPSTGRRRAGDRAGRLVARPRARVRAARRPRDSGGRRPPGGVVGGRAACRTRCSDSRWR